MGSQLSSREIYHAQSRLWLRRYVDESGALVAPSLLLAEVASAIARRTGKIAFAKRVANALRQRDALSLVSLDDALIEKAIEVAADLQLRAGDAIYVALAHQLNIPLVSWDREQLTRAAPLIETYTPDTYPF